MRRSDGVSSPAGTVVSVPADELEALAGVTSVAELERRIPFGSAMFRWCDAPVDLPDAGTWIPADEPRVPPWLRPFGGDVLVVLDGDVYVAGVGLKRHDDWSWELSVGTEPAARGRGLARRLVAKAARRLLDDGLVPTYRHAFENVASAAVAEASGFPDRGWRCHWLGGRPT